MNIILIGSLASMVAGLLTFVGALPVLFIRHVSDKILDALLGFSAGVMLAATAFSLLLPSIEFAGGGFLGAQIASAGFLVGVITLFAADRYIPHQHFIKGREGPSSRSLAKIWLFIYAISIHNFPEGIAVGVSFGNGHIEEGLKVATAIGLQNMPEGLAVAVALLRERYSVATALLVSLLTGLVEPVGGFLGISVVSIAQPLLPWGLAFAAGAMLWVISHEIIPETHRRGFENYATTGLMIGFVIMMMLDNLI